MVLTAKAKIKLIELIKNERIIRDEDERIGFTLVHVSDAYDSRRTNEGKHEFYIAEEAGWILRICGPNPIGFKTQLSKKATELRDIFKPTKIDGLLFYSYGIQVPTITLDYDGKQFTVDGEPVKSNE